VHRDLSLDVLNRKMEQALENLYKQGRLSAEFTLPRAGGMLVRIGLCVRQRRLACADDRNQGSLLVRGFEPRDMMMQYMAKADSRPEAAMARRIWRHYERNVVSPIQCW